MKKLLFIALFAIGFFAQAQNTISIVAFKSASSAAHGDLAYIFDEAQGTKCTDNVTEASDIVVYSFYSDGRLTETVGDGTEELLTTLTGFAFNAIRGSFNVTYNNVHNRNRFGGILEELSSTYSIN